MIRITVLYPNEERKKFDWDYYLNKHMPMAQKMLEPLGLVKLEVDKGVGTREPGAPPPYIAIGYLYFNTMEDFQKAVPTCEESALDLPNYTDIEPIFQISEIV